jgi:hypothetical protein
LTAFYGYPIYKLFDHVCHLYSDKMITAQKKAICQRQPEEPIPDDSLYLNVDQGVIEEEDDKEPLPQWWIGEGTDMQIPKALVIQKATHNQDEIKRHLGQKRVRTHPNVWINQKQNKAVVNICRGSKRLTKSVSAKQHGGLEKAIDLATQYAEEISTKMPKERGGRQRSDRMRNGVPIVKGVYYAKTHKHWVATIFHKSRETKETFALAKFGSDDAAYEAAVKWRQEMELRKKNICAST